MSATALAPTNNLALPAELSDEQRRAMVILHEEGYAAVEKKLGWSRGRTYHLATRLGMRKTEARIRERKAERLRRQREYMEAIFNQTAKADVLDFLDGLPDESVQMFVTSVPYNLGKKYGDCAGADAMSAVYYHGWLMQIISEMSRILKPGGVVFLQSGKTVDWQDELMPIDVLVYEDLRRAGLTFQSRVIWTIPHGLTPKNRLADRYETALVFSKGKDVVFNPNAARIPQKNPGKRAYKGPNKGRLSGHPFGAWPTDVWDDIPTTRHNHPERKHSNHPAQFPVGLVKRAVLLWSLPGDVVCDPFNGSGTTQIGAIQTGRDFVGADLFYEDIRAKRLAAEGFLDAATPLTGVTDESAALWKAELDGLNSDPGGTMQMDAPELPVWQAEAVRVDAKAEPVDLESEEQMIIEFCGDVIEGGI